MNLHINAERAAHIDALAPDRSRVSILLPEMSPEMKKREQRIDQRTWPSGSRVEVMRQLLALSGAESRKA